MQQHSAASNFKAPITPLVIINVIAILAAQSDTFPKPRLLFTCNARGPHMFGAHARDAALFQAPLGRCHLLHITQVFLGRMSNRMGDCVQKWKLLSLTLVTVDSITSMKLLLWSEHPSKRG